MRPLGIKTMMLYPFDETLPLPRECQRSQCYDLFVRKKEASIKTSIQSHCHFFIFRKKLYLVVAVQRGIVDKA
jgi:hypothetical protein